MANPERCQCCNAYAPRAVLGLGADSKVIHGDPPGRCRTYLALEEARRWAIVWKERALEMGYGRVMVRVDPTMPPNSVRVESSIDSVTMVNLGENPQMTMEEANLDVQEAHGGGTAPISPDVDHEKDGGPVQAGPSMEGDLLGLEVDDGAQVTNVVFCAGKRRHAVRYDSPMHEQMLERGCFHCGALPEVVA